MRKTIVLIIGLMLLSLPAYASVSNMVAQLGVYNSTDARYGLEVDSNNDFYFANSTASIYWPGYASAITTNQTLTANQSGQIIILNNGGGVAPNGVIFTLPLSVVGMTYTIISDVAKTFRIAPNAADIINFSTATVGQRILDSAAAKGDSITLFCGTQGQWSILDRNGTWGMDAAQN